MKKLDVPQSGSQADTTASRNRFGQYNRTRASPVQPRTPRQVEVRALLTDASQAWRELTDATRAAWATYAASTPRTDSLGQTVFPTGHQAFVGLWLAFAQVGFDVPPEVPIDAPPSPPTIVAFSAEDDGASTVEVEQVASTTLRLVIDATPLVSAGVSFFADYRFLLSAATGGTPFSIGGSYTAKYGPLVLNRRFAVRCRWVTETGGVSAPAVANTVVVAAGP